MAVTKPSFDPKNSTPKSGLMPGVGGRYAGCTVIAPSVLIRELDFEHQIGAAVDPADVEIARVGGPRHILLFLRLPHHERLDQTAAFRLEEQAADVRLLAVQLLPAFGLRSGCISSADSSFRRC